MERAAKHPLRGKRLCWLETEQRLFVQPLSGYVMRRACSVALSI
jgi:hypothetical protein